MLAAIVLLSAVVVSEFAGLAQTGNLVLLTHLFDVVGDIAFYGIVLLVALVSWKRDAAGRVHEDNHPEEMFAAVVNLAILFLGLVTAGITALINLAHPEAVEGWLAVVGPLLAIVCYTLILGIVQNGDRSISKSIVNAHLLGDLLTSIVVAAVSFVVVWTGGAILNPIGALIAVAILGFIFIRKVNEFRTEIGSGSKIAIRGS
jgi:Co/Zn/Cd efflux system component